MSAKFDVYVDRGVVVVAHVGNLQFDQTNKAIIAAVEAARNVGSKRVLFDLRRAQLANYYSYSVRHAELAPELGLDTGYKLAVVGAPEAHDILSFMVRVARNRGWRCRCFFDVGRALKWLGGI